MLKGVDVVIKGKLYTPSIWSGPIIPPEPPTEPPTGGGEHPAHPIHLPVFPAHPIVIPPDFIGPGVPSHPIVLPPGIWGPTDPRPMPPIYLPPITGAGGEHPAHPIVIPPGSIDGEHPEHPIVIPPPGGGEHPAHPIVIPPGGIDGEHPAHPIVIPPPAPGEPSHPIVIPPDPPSGGTPEPPEIMNNWDVKTYWTPLTGWGVAIVPSEEHPGVPVPSKR